MEDQLRKYMNLMEFRSMEVDSNSEAEIMPEMPAVDVHARLSEIIFKLRSHTDNEGGDYSMGFESGLEMAATMVENLLKSIQ